MMIVVNQSLIVAFTAATADAAAATGTGRRRRIPSSSRQSISSSSSNDPADGEKQDQSECSDRGDRRNDVFIVW